MAASLKEVTQREVDQLHTSVKQLDAQINTLNNRWEAVERFIKRWWALIAAIGSIAAGIFGAGIWAITTYNGLEKKAEADSSRVQMERRLNKRIDDLKKVNK